MSKKLLAVLSLLSMFSLLLLAGCGNTDKKDGSQTSEPDIPKTDAAALPVLQEPVQDTAFLLNTAVTITLYDRGSKDVIRDCFELCQEYENRLSRTISDSEISQLNQADNYPVKVSGTTAALLSLAYYYSDLSGGAFDLTVAPLTALWDFSALKPSVPSPSAIQEAVRHIDYHDVLIDGDSITLTDPDTSIDLGAIAKGYIADRLKDYLLERGVKSAIINLGGNVLCVGSKPDGSAFKIGIQKPFEARNETALVLGIQDMSVVSSGIYERYFKENDVLYHHILDPVTGYPVDNNLVAVSIISPLSADGDGLSTTCFALGLEKGMQLIDSLDGIYAVFITDDYELHYSEGFEENLTIIPD